MQEQDELGQQPSPQTRQERQLRLILDEFGSEVGAGPEDRDRETPTDVRFLFREGYVLVRDEYLARVQAALEGRPTDQAQLGAERPRPELVQGVTPGVSLLRLTDRSTLDALERIRQILGPGIAVPDHLVSISNGREGAAGYCPATEPEVVPAGIAPDPWLSRNRAAGEGVRVVVVDTGLDPTAADTHSWMEGVDGERDRGILTSGRLGPYAGHGTFVAGVVRSIAPRCEVYVKRVLHRVGATFESDLVRALDDVLGNDFPDIVSMSAGTESYDATGLFSFEAFARARLLQHKGVAFVVAAGNNGSRHPFWPAAASWTVSVGALARDWCSRATFSNLGGWVDIYAPGEDLINAFPTGNYAYREPPLADTVGSGDFKGMAKWSGTSFSTPVVAGLIAARMSRTGENGQDAAAALLSVARSQAVPGVGAVLLPEGTPSAHS